MQCSFHQGSSAGSRHKASATLRAFAAVQATSGSQSGMGEAMVGLRSRLMRSSNLPSASLPCFPGWPLPAGLPQPVCAAQRAPTECESDSSICSDLPLQHSRILSIMSYIQNISVTPKMARPVITMHLLPLSFLDCKSPPASFICRATNNCAAVAKRSCFCLKQR